jgi:MFS family permease
MLSALAFFTLGSSLAPLASSTPLILAARSIQGVGGGGIVALTYIITANLVSLQERGKWFGLISLQWAIGSTVGPLMGGVIAEHSDWRWIFCLNIPFCVVGFVSVPLVLCDSFTDQSKVWTQLRDLDWLGAIILLCSIASCLVPLTLGKVLTIIIFSVFFSCPYIFFFVFLFFSFILFPFLSLFYIATTLYLIYSMHS